MEVSQITTVVFNRFCPPELGNFGSDVSSQVEASSSVIFVMPGMKALIWNIHDGVGTMCSPLNTVLKIRDYRRRSIYTCVLRMIRYHTSRKLQPQY